MKRSFLALLCLFSYLFSESLPEACLLNPVFAKGMLSTEEGGVIRAPAFRLQARKICYRKDLSVNTVEAKESVLVEFDGIFFIAEELKYDFLAKRGELTNGTTSLNGWFIFAEKILLNPDGSFDLFSAAITTDESSLPTYELTSGNIHISKELHLDTKETHLVVTGFPRFPIPAFGVNLRSFGKSPLQFSFGWGGRMGPKVGARLQILDAECASIFLRGDFRLSRGFGGGVEGRYRSPDKNFTFESTNYIAQDSAILHPNQTIRYCIRGQTEGYFDQNKCHLHGSWDKLSDIDMATDFKGAGLELDYPGRTQLFVTRQERYANLFLRGRLRVNDFQTVKQELPTFSLLLRPYRIEKSGIITGNELKMSYLNFAYSQDSFCSNDFNAVRIMDTFRASRPVSIASIRTVPTIGGNLIFYGNSKEGGSRFLASAFAELSVSKTWYKNFGSFVNSYTPYVVWQYMSYPTSSPKEHYIFDIEDGIFHLNATRVGITQNVIALPSMNRPITIDLYGFVFIQSRAIPKLFCDSTLFLLPSCKEVLEVGYDLSKHKVDRLNIRHEWTLNTNLSIYLEYRQRSAFSYRKASFDNFFLESYRSTRELLHSQVSDRRNTLLSGLFWRFHPRFALEWISRNGWNRKREPTYFEFDINLLAHLTSHFLVKISFQNKEDDKRVTLSLTLDPSTPAKNSSCFSLPFAF